MRLNHIIIASGVALLLASCDSKKEEEKGELVSHTKYVKSTTVIEKKYSPPVYAFGKLAEQEESRLSFKIGGIVQAIYVKPGTENKEGPGLSKAG